MSVLRIVSAVACAVASTGCAGRLPPAPSVATTSSADGVSLSYEVAGRGATTVVLIHGLSCDRSYWGGQVGALATRYRVVALDLGGHGASGIDRASWTIASLAGDVVAVVRAVGARQVILVGHSLGGPVALEAALRMPDRVIGVVGVDTFFDAFGSADWEGFVGQFRPDFRAATERVVRATFPHGADSTLVATVANRVASARPEVAIPLMEDLGNWARSRFAIAIDSLHRPLAIIMAGEPAPVPRLLQSHQSALPHFEAHGMVGVGHFPMLENPQRFNQILDAILARMVSHRAA